ncbi:MAG: hypothetical protein J6W88_04140 [Bacteroidales bacterium]|nr:hypothetical protein [Bacteroidales bacterium]
MSYKEFAPNTFWGRFVDDMILFIILDIFYFLFLFVIKSFNWDEVFIGLGVDIVLALIFAALGFGWTKYYYKGIENIKKKKE